MSTRRLRGFALVAALLLLDVSLSFTLDPAKVPAIYAKYRSDIDRIAHLERA